MSTQPQVQLPQLIYQSETAVLIACPFMSREMQSEEDAAALSSQVCVHCGFWRDAQVLDQDLHLKYKGEKRFSLMCFNPSNPALPEILKKIQEGSL